MPVTRPARGLPGFITYVLKEIECRLGFANCIVPTSDNSIQLSHCQIRISTMLTVSGLLRQLSRFAIGGQRLSYCPCCLKLAQGDKYDVLA